MKPKTAKYSAGQNHIWTVIYLDRKNVPVCQKTQKVPEFLRSKYYTVQNFYGPEFLRLRYIKSPYPRGERFRRRLSGQPKDLILNQKWCGSEQKTAFMFPPHVDSLLSNKQRVTSLSRILRVFPLHEKVCAVSPYVVFTFVMSRLVSFYLFSRAICFS